VASRQQQQHDLPHQHQRSHHHHFVRRSKADSSSRENHVHASANLGFSPVGHIGVGVPFFMIRGLPILTSVEIVIPLPFENTFL